MAVNCCTDCGYTATSGLSRCPVVPHFPHMKITRSGLDFAFCLFTFDLVSPVPAWDTFGTLVRSSNHLYSLGVASVSARLSMSHAKTTVPAISACLSGLIFKEQSDQL